MTALLPPDPSVSGWYWLRAPNNQEVMKRWDPLSSRWWLHDGSMRVPPHTAADLGWTFASATPHRIPTAEELDAVYAAMAEAPADCKDPCPTVATYYIGLQHMAAKIRTALGGTP